MSSESVGRSRVEPSKARGRRSAGGARRGWSPVVIAVVAVPLLVAGGLWSLKATPEPAQAVSPPTPSALDAIDLLCPSPLDGVPTLAVARAEQSESDDTTQAEGEISVGLGDATTPLDVPVGGVAVSPAPTEADAISGTGGMAPGLVGSLAEAKPRAASDCRASAAEQWFTGVGAGPTHSSQLELLNPDDANAVADITVYSDEGIVDVPDCAGWASRGVPACGSTWPTCCPNAVNSA